MKITVATNGKIETFNTSSDRIEIDYTPSPVFSDFEIWVEDESGKLVDYKRVNLMRRGKLKMTT